MDTITKQQRSVNMGAIKSKDTAPERKIRQIVYHLGYRYRLHDIHLPGKPDIVFKSRHKVIFVHGCFWHQHNKNFCLDSHIPHSNGNYWKDKLYNNVKRGKKHIRELRIIGWDVLVIWECEIRNLSKTTQKIQRYLDR
jgi:DNA mismatch endonuclease, patch repair protein